jgi:hypothetical protein
MKTLDEVWGLVESLNEEAHSMAWDSWTAADEMAESDEEDSDVTAEQMREDASLEQAEYFRDEVWQLNEVDHGAIKHWLKTDESFREQFRDWYGHDEFDEEYSEEQ